MKKFIFVLIFISLLSVTIFASELKINSPWVKSGTQVTVTNSYVTANSIVLAVAATNDATARVTSVVAAAGSFTIYTTACIAETAFNFFVIGQ